MDAKTLQTPIDYLKGVGPNRADLLKTELGVHTFQDLLQFFPFRYIDKSRFYKIAELQDTSAEVQIIGKITNVRTVPMKKGKRLVAEFEDETGSMELVWFRGHKWILENLKINTPYVIFGKLNYFNGSFSMPHPEIDEIEKSKIQYQIKLQPVYPSTEKLSKRGISNRVISTLILGLLEQAKTFQETLPNNVLSDLKMLSKT
ncbi:MAG: OB-fold nucleic acid binding domain-containing protein, partial [Psychroflexus sp.]